MFIILLRIVFWKANSRKVFTIPAPVKKEVSFVRLDADDTDSDNSETAPAVRKGLMIHVLIALVVHTLIYIIIGIILML